MFVGRTAEMSELNRLYGTDSFEMPVIYGRRRVGKTRLITEFIQGKKAIYFQARRTNAEANLHGFSQAILAGSVGVAGVSFRSFDEAFDALATMARTERLIVVIDEYPYLAQSNPEISSLLQDKIDHLYKETKLMLILCGSSLSFMEEQVLGYESPLYGRRTAQFKIMAVVWIILTVGFFILGVKYSLLWGFLIAFLDFLPVFGAGTALLPWGIIKLLGGEYAFAAGLLLIYVLTQVIRQVVQPKLVGDSLGLNPILTLLFLYLGFKLKGIAGMILAVPCGMFFVSLYNYGAFRNITDSLKELADILKAFMNEK